MPRKSKHSHEEIKMMAVLAAREIIISGGLKSVTARAIAEKVNYSIGTLYNIFGGIDDIIYEVCYEILGDLIMRVNVAVDCSNSPYEKLQAFVRILGNFIEEEKGFAEVVFLHSPEKDKTIPACYVERINQLFRVVYDVFVQFFPNVGEAECQKAAEVYSSSVFGLMMAVTQGRLSAVCQDSTAVISEFLFAMYMTGMQTLNVKSKNK